MADNSTPILGPVIVWTLPAIGATGHLLTANAASFPWGWGWQREPLLQATGNKFTKLPGAMGRGTFVILRDRRQEPDSARMLTYNSPLIAGQYVCITADDDSTEADQLDPANVLWWGWISAISYSQLQGTLDGVGTATALEVGHLLDQQQVVNWLEASADGLSGEPVTAPPTANLGDSSSYIVGNATAGVGIGAGGDIGYAFTRRPDDCGNADGDLWTRWRLLRHLLYGCWPGGLPTPTLACADGSEGAAGPQDNDPTGGIAGFLNDTDTPEVYDLRNLTLKGAIDLCVPRSRGFNWTLELVGTKGWQIVVYSYASLGGSGGLPVNGTNDFFDYISPGSGTDLTVDSLTTDVKVVSDSGTMPDEVVVEGSPIVIGNTVSFPDGNLTIGWQRGVGHQEDAFRIGASGAADYGSLTPDEQLERNASVRTSAGLRDVYTRYGLYAYDGNDDITVRALPGPGLGGQAYFLCPQLNWDGSTLTIDTKASRCPYLPASTLARTLPWPDGVKGDGTDLRPVQNRYLPTFIKPKVLRYDATEPMPWVDFEAQNGRSGYPSMSLEVDDRGMAFRVTLSSPIYLAYNHWTDAAGGTTTPAAADIDPDVDPMSVDYTTLVATVGVESDQRVRVAIKRPGVNSDAQVRRRLVLREPSLQCWLMRSGSIIGLLPDGTPERVSNGGSAFDTITGSNGDAAIAIRNDFPAAQKRCEMAAAWAFRERNSVVIQRAAPHLPPEYARIGYLITNLIESAGDRINPAASLTVNTAVEEVAYEFSSAPRVTIATAMPEMIGFAAIQGGVVGGGQVSTVLGGTVSQAVQKQQQTTMQLGGDTQRIPIVVPQVAPAKSQRDPHATASSRNGTDPHVYAAGDVVESTSNLLEAFATFRLASVSATGAIGVVISVGSDSGGRFYTIGIWGRFYVDPSIFVPTGTGNTFATFYLSMTAGVLVQSLSALQSAGTQVRPVLAAVGFSDVVDGASSGTQRQIIVFGNELIGNRDAVADLTDVTLSSPANGDGLIYDSASKQWKNAVIPGAGNRAATSVIGNPTGSPAAATDIAASADNTALLRISGSLLWAKVPNAALQNSSLTISGTAPIVIGGSGTLGATTTIAVSDATTGAKGVVQLAGDLAGTATAPVIGPHKIDATKLQQVVALTVLGNSSNVTADMNGMTAATDGQILQRQGTALGFFSQTQYQAVTKFTSSSTFTVPANVYAVFVLARGGGGGGGGTAAMASASALYGASGGGEGGMGIGWLSVTPGQALTVTVGSGGAGGLAGANNGSTGGTSSVTNGTVTVQGLGGGGGTGTAGSASVAVGLGGGVGTTSGIQGACGGVPCIRTMPVNTGPPTSIQSIAMDGGPGGGSGNANSGSGGAGAAGSFALGAQAGTNGIGGYVAIYS